MKRFLSMLAMAVLVLQSVATSAVYATDIVNENEESDSVPVVETAVVDEDVDEGGSDEVTTDLSDLEENEDSVEGTVVDDLDAVENDTEESQPVSYGKSFSSESSYQSWREISTNGLMVTAEDPLGAFPNGTEMVVTAVEEDEVFDLVNDAIEANVTKVRAVDITFWYDGDEIEPSQPINVTIRALNMTEPQTVVHIDDEENVEEIDADINGKTAEFEAESFSIYALVETDDPRLLVNFYDGNGDIITGIYVKDGDNFDDLIFDPGIGDSDEGKVFKGWTLDPDYNTGTEAWTIQGVRDYVSDNIASLGTGIDFYAMMFDRYVIKYFDMWGAVVIDTDEVLLRCAEQPCSYEYYVDHGYNTTNPDENLLGWKVNGEGNSILYTGITINGDIELWADVKPGHWLIFNENGKGATYNAPRFVETNDVTTSGGLLEMIRFGYTFDNWYEAAEVDGSGNLISLKTEPFVFGKILTGNTTIYANWINAATGNYTVLVWKQNVAGNGYDFETGLSLNGNVGATINTVSERGNGTGKYASINNKDYRYTGFYLKEYDSNVTITPEGNAVVNVYYDRNEYTLSFQINDYIYTETTSDNGTQYGVVNNNYIRIYYRNGEWRTSNSNYGTVYNGARYTRSNNTSWHSIKEIKALYQQNISSNFPITGTNGVTYNNGERWMPQNSRLFNNVIVFLEVMPDENTIFHLDEATHTTKTIKYYVESLSGSTPDTTYQGVNYTLYNTVHSNIGFFVESLDWIDLVGYTKKSSDPVFPANGELRNVNSINFYYTRNIYTINFMDGKYVDGNSNPIEEPNQGQLEVVDNIVYGENISGYNAYEPDTAPAGYVFEGWYIDDACTQPYTFTTMPEGGLTVYAKWRQIQYRVFLHPNAENDPSLDWGSDNQQMNFRVSYGGKISTPTGIRTGYIFGGWYQDTGLNIRFNSEAYVLNDNNVTTPYDQTDCTDPMDKWGNCDGTKNSDAEYKSGDIEGRFWITRKLDLYAKWSKEIPGASGINLVYDLSGGSLQNSVDDKLYGDNSDASVLSAPTKVGYQFDHWVIQKWNGSEFVDTEVTRYPGETFKVLLDNAKEESVNNPENPEITKKYTIQVRAEYVLAGEAEITNVKYCPGYEGVDCVTSEAIVVNNKYVIEGEDKFTREGYTFVNWQTSDGKSYSGGATVGVDNVNSGTLNILTAQWKINEYTITASVEGENGEVAPETQTVEHGADAVVITFTPAEKYTVKSITVDNIGLTTGARDTAKVEGYTFKEVKADHELVVTYAEDENGNDIPDDEENFKITPSVTNGTINPASEVSKVYGSNQEVTYEKETGYALKSVTVDGSEVDRDEYKSSYTFSYITGDHTIEVVYAEDENGNDIPDDEEYRIIIYTDGVDNEEVFVDVVYTGVLDGLATPTFGKAPIRSGYIFNGWNPKVAETVNGDQTYEATWKEDKNNNDIDDNEELVSITFKAGDHGNIEGEAEYITEKNLLPGYDNYPAAPEVTAEDNYDFNGWNPDYTAGEMIPLENATLEFTAKWDCVSGYHYEGADGATAEICVSNRTTIGELCGELESGSNQVYQGGSEDTRIEYNEENGWNEEYNCGLVCAPQYHEEEQSCVPDIKEVETPDVCGVLAEDSHAYYLHEAQTLTYENGKWSEPNCEAVCESNYRPVEENTNGNQEGANENENNADYGQIINYDGVVNGVVRVNNLPTTNDETENNEVTENNVAQKVNNFRCEIMTNTVTFDLNGGTIAQGVETQVTVVSGDTVKEIATSRNNHTFQGWTLDGQTFDFSTPITSDITLVAQWKSNGGGGGGGGTPDVYKCENLPENAVANNTNKPNRNTDYTYSEDTSKVCTFQCKSGYTRDKDDKKCVKSENPGGDNGGGDDEEIELGGQVSDKCSVEGTNRSEEEIAAYLYACENDITTIRDIEKARLGDFLTRAEMAKMISVFATKELGMKPNTSKDCSNFANSIASYNQEMKDYMVMSCQLEIMGIHTTNYEPIPDFMPSKRVSRAEFGTVLSRILWGNKYEGTNSNYYINHLNALKENNIITNINPNITEYRAWVFLMLYRSVEAIKAMKANTNETVEEQVNEELAEEGKAETGLVLEYDSGSVVPDMATVTESGTLATGAVAEVETGSVVEDETGDTASLTGDDISKEVSVETGATAETETGSTTD